MDIPTGLRGEAALAVEQKHTARTFGSGDVDVFATPAVVALCEQAAVKALERSLGPDETTVGISIALEHLAPTPVGGSVSAEAALVSVDGRRLTFEVQAQDRAGIVARGEHVRMVVDRERFLAGAAKRG